VINSEKIMIVFCTDLQQDTIQGKIVIKQDSVQSKSDSVSIIKDLQSKDSSSHKPVTASKIIRFVLSDTTSVCKRNSITDVTFYDSDNVIAKIGPDFSNRFPFLFTERNRQLQAEAKVSLVKQLKSGQDLPARQFHDDWVIGIILIAAFLFSLIRATSKSLFPGVPGFFLFRGINDPSSRDIGGLFHWHSTILNLISFFVIGLFSYFAAYYFNLIPPGISGLLFWLISLAIIISAVTLRHIICLITGNISGEKEVFSEYLLGVYQSYRFSAFFLFVLVIIISYTSMLPVRGSLISGFIVLGIMYMIRVLRLLIIFINRNISIFYLILYLCALEILPVLISVKYFTGLV
jgi:hypothetical protein